MDNLHFRNPAHHTARMPRRILYLSGTRADFGLMRHALQTATARDGVIETNSLSTLGVKATNHQNLRERNADIADSPPRPLARLGP